MKNWILKIKARFYLWLMYKISHVPFTITDVSPNNGMGFDIALGSIVGSKEGKISISLIDLVVKSSDRVSTAFLSEASEQARNWIIGSIMMASAIKIISGGVPFKTIKIPILPPPPTNQNTPTMLN